MAAEPSRPPEPTAQLLFGMAITVTPTGATLGAYVTGVALRSIDDEQWGKVEAAWHEHGVLVFPGQHLTHDEQVEFSTRVGTLERLAEAKTETRRVDISRISNVTPDGVVVSGPERAQHPHDHRQHGLAQRQFVPPGVGQGVVVVRARGAFARRRDRVRRHACCVRRVGRRSQAATRGTSRHALVRILARQGRRPRRSVHARGASTHGAGRASHRAHASRHGAQVVVHRPPRLSRHRHGRRRRTSDARRLAHVGVSAAACVHTPLDRRRHRDVGQPLRAAPRIRGT